MAPFPVAVPDAGGLLHGAPEQRVDQRRLADPGRPDEGDGRAGREKRVERGEPGAREGAEEDDRDPGGDGGDDPGERLRVLRQVGLVDEDHRPRARGVDEREVPLQPAGVQVAPGGRDDEDEIDVRRDRLVGPVPARETAGEDALSGEDVHDRGGRRLLLPEQHDEVADRRQAPRPLQGAGGVSADAPVRGDHVEDGPLPARDSSGQIRTAVSVERGGEGLVPSQGLEGAGRCRVARVTVGGHAISGSCTIFSGR